MAALFAVGVMSLGWMALIAAFIAAEKLLPWPRALATPSRWPARTRARRRHRPGDVPGFAEPSGQAMHDGGGHDAGMEMMR